MRSGKSALYEDLKRQILTMELDPDEALDEVTLCERYGVSRTPIREVFRRLEGEGYLCLRENHGARVSPLDYSTLRNFFLVAPMVYGAIARLAVQNFSSRQLDELKATQQRFKAATASRDTMAMVVENNRFHAIMGEMANNQYLDASLGRLLIDHARIGATFFRPRTVEMEANLDVSANHHDLIIEAIERVDEEAVVKLVFEHWELSRDNMEMFIAPQGLRDGLRNEAQT